MIRGLGSNILVAELPDGEEIRVPLHRASRDGKLSECFSLFTDDEKLTGIKAPHQTQHFPIPRQYSHISGLSDRAHE